MTGRIAVLGASGFIGNRTVEVLHQGGADVLPVVRRASGLALPCRFDLPVRVADARSQHEVEKALVGCDAAVASIAGDPQTIVGIIEPIYRAASAAGVRRLVYLSTASVHGQSPPPGTDETSPLSDRQPIEYNNAKVRAERRLLRCRATGTTEVVLLRPGIVWGPRSPWTGGLADELLAGQAVLVGGGHGICNSTYVDNLVHAIRLALVAPQADRQALLVGDRERITWRDLYRPVAEALDVELELVATPDPTQVEGRKGRAERLRTSPLARRLLPAPIRAGLRAAYETRRGATATSERTSPETTLEQALLHTCAHQLPWTRARAVLGYEPLVSFEDGCRRSRSWLEFAGYPVHGRSSG